MHERCWFYCTGTISCSESFKSDGSLKLYAHIIFPHRHASVCELRAVAQRSHEWAMAVFCDYQQDDAFGNWDGYSEMPF